MTGISNAPPIFRMGCALFLAWTASVCALAQTPPRSDPKPKDKDLARRLMRKAVASSEEDVMDAIIRLMKQASRKLEIEFDAGDETQAVQQHITNRLDEAIKIAAAQRRPIRSRRKSPSGDKRRMPSGPKGQDQRKTSGQAQDGDTPAPGTGQTPANDSGRATTGGEMKEQRRTWGQLPMRQRDEVIQGVNERFLERYRAWIEEYYRALQDPDE